MKTIKLLTTNNLKKQEFKKFFDLYGIELVNENQTFTMSEETVLLNKNLEKINDISSLKNLQIVYSQSTLNVEFEDGTNQTYVSDLLKGYIDLSKKENHKSVFGWDDIFVLPFAGLSLFEVSKINSKVSSRQKNLSSFVAEHLHYKERLSTKFNKVEAEETIMIDHNVFMLLKENKYLNSPSVISSGIHEILKKSLKNGAFFRSSKTRREKNYWFPGLNAGIPLVEKKDEIHEITFAVHDLFHFVIPDILLNGKLTRKNKKNYIIGRMMSEAISLVLADGWFIQNLKKDFEYDYSKRAIYPLFENIDLNNQENLKKAITSMVYYVLKGDINYLKEITNNEEAITNFKNKYDAFFVEDYKWTFINYSNLVSRTEQISDWFKTCHIEDEFDNVNDYIEEQKELIIKEILNSFLEKIFEKEEFNQDLFFSNSFKRYMLGQCFIFSTFKNISISQQFKRKILFSLSKPILNKEECLNIKNFFKLYVEELHRMNLIDDDQSILFKEIYPLFDPSFAFYDKEKEFYKQTINDFYINLGE